MRLSARRRGLQQGHETYRRVAGRLVLGILSRQLAQRPPIRVRQMTEQQYRLEARDRPTPAARCEISWEPLPEGSRLGRQAGGCLSRKLHKRG